MRIVNTFGFRGNTQNGENLLTYRPECGINLKYPGVICPKKKQCSLIADKNGKNVHIAPEMPSAQHLITQKPMPDYVIQQRNNT